MAQTKSKIKSVEWVTDEHSRNYTVTYTNGDTRASYLDLFENDVKKTLAKQNIFKKFYWDLMYLPVLQRLEENGLIASKAVREKGWAVVGYWKTTQLSKDLKTFKRL